MTRRCSIPGCEKPLECRGWCAMHYQRWRHHGNPLTVLPWSCGDRKVTSVIDKFWAKVNKKGPTVSQELGPCWDWTAATRNGYGVFHPAKDETVQAHRFSLEVKLERPLGPRMQARHRCDRPICVRPFHLLEGTNKDNVHDAVSRNRHKRGENDLNAKLTAESVLDIRVRAASGELLKNLAADYKISSGLVSNIVAGKRWKHVGGPLTMKYKRRSSNDVK